MLDPSVHPFSYKLRTPTNTSQMQQDNPNPENFNKSWSIVFTQGRKNIEALANSNNNNKKNRTNYSRSSVSCAQQKMSLLLGSFSGHNSWCN